MILGKGITNEDTFIDHALIGIREFMEEEGQEFIYRRFIAPAIGTVEFAKAFDRSVTGSINELSRTGDGMARRRQIAARYRPRA